MTSVTWMVALTFEAKTKNEDWIGKVEENKV